MAAPHRPTPLSLSPLLIAGVATLGCGQATTPPTGSTAATTAAATPTPAAEAAPQVDAGPIRLAAERFVSSLLRGDGAAAAEWMTAAAAQRVAGQPELLNAIGGIDASFEVAEARLVSATEAAVQCFLTPTGTDTSEELLCLLKRDGDAWRVSGLAWESAPGTPTRMIQFEPTPTPGPGNPPAGRFVTQPPAGSPGDAPRTAAEPGVGLR